MSLTAEQCWEHLRAADHAVLCTHAPGGAIDAVPVCFVVVGTQVVTPIDRVKPKRTTELGRLRNLERDGTATLLCEHWDGDDWSRLWWVRARLRRRPGHDGHEQLRRDGENALRTKYAPYRHTDFADLLLFDVEGVTGWAATPA